MKTKPFFFVLLAVILSGVLSWGQTAKIHIYNTRMPSMRSTETITPMPAGSKPIRISSGKYVLLETVQDSLGFLLKDIPFYMPIERGKDVYLRLSIDGQDTIFGKTKVDEVSEREFKWMLLINRHPPKPDETFLF
ncbi:MAG: hypothetical protein MUE30_08945 [Spirosomaceae bacterium]|nr:hypothetical protein [Spirosomataceae bacterium]